MEKLQYAVVLGLCSFAVILTGCPPNGGGDADADTESKDTTTQDTDPMDTDGTETNDTSDTDDDGTGDDTMADSSDDTSGTDGGDTDPPRFEAVECAGLANVTDITVGPGKQYVPADVTIQKGETVKWTWASGVQFPHDVVADDDSDCSSAQPDWFSRASTSNVGTTYCVRFNETGTWNYQCTVGNHCQSGMKGTVTVQSN